RATASLRSARSSTADQASRFAPGYSRDRLNTTVLPSHRIGPLAGSDPTAVDGTPTYPPPASKVVLIRRAGAPRSPGSSRQPAAAVRGAYRSAARALAFAASTSRSRG